MTDQDTTSQMPADEPPTEQQPPERRRLLRSRSDRMLGGVAGGLGEYFAVDSLIFRIGFGVSVFFGGLGALAYLVLYLFVPSARGDGTVGRPPIQRSPWLAAAGVLGIFILLGSWGVFDGDPWPFDRGWFIGGPLLLIAVVAGLFYALRRSDRPEPGAGGDPREPRGILATIALAVGAAIGLCALALLAAWAGATGSGDWIAAVIVAVGVLLVLAAFRGGARWLIVPAVVLAGSLSAVAAADVSFDGGIGERSYEPVSASAIPDDGYSLGIGQLGVDLRSLDWEDDQVVTLDADLGIGQVVIAVPEHVCVTGEVSAGAGELDIAGDTSDGFDVEAAPEAGTSATPRLVLDAEVDLGVVQVLNDDDVDIGDHHRGPWDGDDLDEEAMADAMAAACAPPPDRGARG